MLSNYLTIALRNFRRQPIYTLLNIAGLTLGIAAALLILLFITEESRFDTYHEQSDRIYRISSDITEPDNAFKWAVTQSPLAMQLKEDYPEVEQYVRFIPNGRTNLQYKDNFFFEEKVFLVDSTVMEIFSFDFITGDASKALIEPNSIALSESVADRIFGNNNPMGEVLITPSGRKYNVTGVYRDMPKHSHLIANALISSNTIPGLGNPTAGAWGGFSLYTYVLLKEGTDPANFAAKLPDVVENYVAVIFDEFNIKVKYELIPLTDIHLKSDFEGEPEPLGEISFLYIFGAVALFMILLACINYMNLSTARATKRAMEVGVRKVLGSERKQLIWQFMIESLLFTVIAIVLSFLLVLIVLPLFNNTFNLSLNRALLFSKPVLLGALGLIGLTGILAGSYPAFYLSAFKPITVLKGQLSRGSGNPILRKVLVAVQFAVTLFMIVGTGVIYDQMSYLRNKDLGFDKEHVLTFNLQGRAAREKYPVIRERLLQNPKILKTGTASSTLGEGTGKQLMNVENGEGVMEQYGVDNYAVDFDFFSTMNIEFTAGRDYSGEFGADSTLSVIVNESMVERMGWADPIGRRVQFGPVDTLPMAKVIGVVKDFHQRSLYDPIEALLFRPRFNNQEVHVRLAPQDPESLRSTIAFVNDQWREVFPNTPFEFDFVDAAFMELYEADQVRARIFTLFSILMILVACLGLLGLASFTAEQRTKEIGVRRILGAKTGDIVYLLTRNFVVLVAIATIPAFIAAFYFMNQWLGTFSYHTQMNFWLYGLAFVTVALITLMTTSYHALKAARGNPVEALRYE
ncbi:MAG: FtsX-like permease family protein [Cyanothece sp. SIO1E1]|nr:FtsX-like permease family protein [Cyanothece sp. SIO1E1]